MGRRYHDLAATGKLLEQMVNKMLSVQHEEGLAPAHAYRLPSGQDNCRKIYVVHLASAFPMRWIHYSLFYVRRL